MRHIQMKCLHFKGAMVLTLSEPPESVPSPRTADSVNAATISSLSESMTLISEATVLLLLEDEVEGSTAGWPMASVCFVMVL